MNSVGEPPVRTEEDLRAALVALEGRAPSADAVLRVVRERAGQHAGHGRGPVLRGLRSPGWPRLAVGVATAAAAAGLTFALLPGGTPAGRGKVSVAQGPTLPPIESRHDLPAAATVGQAMLTAFSAASDDILYQTETDWSASGSAQFYQDWYWPARPVPGQPQRWREAVSQRDSPGAPLKLAEDTGFSYVVPPPSRYLQKVHGKITDVCYAGAGQASCNFFPWLKHPAGTWLVYQGRFPYLLPLTSGLSPQDIARQIANGQWRVTGRTHVNGQPVIELTATPAAKYQGHTVLWVNAHTYLPVQMIEGAGKHGGAQDNWSYLKPTRTNQALLRVPIPTDYKRAR